MPILGSLFVNHDAEDSAYFQHYFSILMIKEEDEYYYKEDYIVYALKKKINNK